MCVSHLITIGADNGLSPGQRQAIYLEQSWNIVNWIPRNKLQWNFNQNSSIFIQENAFDDVICKVSSILSRPQLLTLNGLFDAVFHECDPIPLHNMVHFIINKAKK